MGVRTFLRYLVIFFVICSLVLFVSMSYFVRFYANQSWEEITAANNQTAITNSAGRNLDDISQTLGVNGTVKIGSHVKQNANKARKGNKPPRVKRQLKLPFNTTVALGSPIVIVSTPGTDAHTVSEILASSTIPIARQRNRYGESSQFNQLMQKLLRHHKELSGPISLQQLSEPQRVKLLQSLYRFRNATSLKAYDRKHSVFTISSNVCPVWSFQSSFAYFILPILKEVFPNMVLIHVFEDGVYSSLSRSYRKEDLDIQARALGLSSKETQLSDKQNYAVQVMQLWSQANTQITRWGMSALGNKYIQFRLEEFCKNQEPSITSLLNKLGLNVKDSTKILEYVLQTRSGSINRVCSRPLGNFLLVKDFGIGFVNKLHQHGIEGLKLLNYSVHSDRHIGVEKARFLRYANMTAVNNTVAITFATSSYQELFMNWYAAIRNLGIERPLVICMDRNCKKSLSSYGIPHYFDTSSCCPATFWDTLAIRMQYIYILTGHGYTVLSSDIDSVWKTDLRPVLMSQDGHIQSIAGKPPAGLENAWTSGALSGSLLFLRASQETHRFWRKVVDYTRNEKYDIIAMNEVASKLGLNWDDSEQSRKRGCVSGKCIHGDIPSSNLHVVLHDRNTFISSCNSSLIIGNYSFVHADCAERNTTAKVDFLKSLGTWNLRPDWLYVLEKIKPFSEKASYHARRQFADFQTSSLLIPKIISNNSLKLDTAQFSKLYLLLQNSNSTAPLEEFEKIVA